MFAGFITGAESDQDPRHWNSKTEPTQESVFYIHVRDTNEENLVDNTLLYEKIDQKKSYSARFKLLASYF